MGVPLYSLAVGLLISIVLGYPAMLLAKQLNLIDIPGSASHKTHLYPTPLAGGILLVCVLAIVSFLFRQYLKRDILVVFLGAVVIFIFGIWDDRKGLAARPKLVGQLIATTILILLGVQVHFMTFFAETGNIPLFVAETINILITMFWVIGITNAMNMIDSMDGIVAGLGVIAFALFGGAATLAGQTTLAIWSAVLLGICAGLYFWNKVASKFFLGDSGAQTIGFLLASFGILYNPLNRSPESSWIVPIMLLSVPIFDTTLVVLSRFRRRQMIGSGRRDHTYHRLIALGYSPKFSVFITHVVSFSVSCLAFLTLYLTPIIAMLFFVLALFCGLIALLWLERKPTLDEQAEGKKSA